MWLFTLQRDGPSREYRVDVEVDLGSDVDMVVVVKQKARFAKRL